MNRILYLILLGADLTAAILTGHPAFTAVFIAMLALPAVSALPLLLKRTKISFAWQGPLSAQKNKEFRVSLDGVQSGFFPAGRIKALIEVRNLMTNETSYIKAEPGKNSGWTFESIYSGCLQFAVKKAVVYDWFGLIGAKLTADEIKRIPVMPATFPLEVSKLTGAALADDPKEYSPYKKGQDRSETFQIRDYAAGDDIRSIHWKLSSKTGKLLVKDPSQPVDDSLLVYWDRKENEDSPVCADVLCESVTSLLRGLIDAGNDFHLAWNEDILRIKEIASEEELAGAVSEMMKAEPPKGGLSGMDLLLKEGEPERRGVILYFCREIPENLAELKKTSNVMLFVCRPDGHDGKEDGVILSPANYVEEMQQAMCI